MRYGFGERKYKEMILKEAWVSVSVIFFATVLGLAQNRPASPGIEPPVVTSGTALPAPLRPEATIPVNAPVQAGPTRALGFQEAVQLSVQNNFTGLIARERINAARGRAAQSRAALLPTVTGTVIQQNETINLAAMGFQPGTFPGSLPLLIGPFNNFDARARLVQSIFSWQAIEQYRVGQEGVALARYEGELTKQQIITQTALAYLNSLRANRSVETARINLTLAQSLLTLAQDQRNAGVATGVDVTRAETRVAEEQVRLTQAQAAAQQARLALLRITGLSLAGELTLTDTLQFIPESVPAAEQVIAEAGRERLEIRVAEEQLKVSDRTLSAYRAERYPSLDFFGDYGESGNTPVRRAVPTRTVGVRLNIPIFNGGRLQGRIDEARSLQRQAELQVQDTRAQVEEDVRLSIQNVGTTTEQVRAAQQTVTLAERELQMARDRFAAGVANNLEVINAQTSLANAREAEVTALTQYNAARINLAAARGHVEAFRW